MTLKVAEGAVSPAPPAAFSRQADHDLGDRSGGQCASAMPEADVPAVTALTSAVLQAAHRRHRESLNEFALRAGIPPDVAAAAEDGTRPAWAMPYPQFADLADAAASGDPALRQLFETAVAC